LAWALALFSAFPSLTPEKLRKKRTNTPHFGHGKPILPKKQPTRAKKQSAMKNAYAESFSRSGAAHLGKKNHQKPTDSTYITSFSWISALKNAKKRLCRGNPSARWKIDPSKNETPSREKLGFS
jgi:hypothetical protein